VFAEKDGGYLVTFGEAYTFAIDALRLQITNAFKNAKNEQFLTRGSLLRIKVDNKKFNPLRN
jgi:hypothetical protein